jgi:hypothetical protein
LYGIVNMKTTAKLKITIIRQYLVIHNTVNPSEGLPDLVSSVVDPHHFYAAPSSASGENFDAAPALAPTLRYSKPKFFKGLKVNIKSDILFSSDSVS